VFEGGLGRGLVVANAATQVVIANNIFVNHSTDAAISIIDATPANGFPTRSVIVKGNVIDLTCVEGQVENDRVGVAVGASNVIVADNQIYARGAASGRTTGISIADHAVGVHVHDNLIESCGHGIRTGARTYLWNPQTKGFAFEFRHTESEVVEVTGPCTFRDQALPSAWDWQDAYRGWSLRWLTGANAGKTSIIERFEAGKRAIALKDGLPMSPGDRFAVHPRQANWQVHHNTIQNCTHPLVVDLLGGENVVLKDNLISPTPIAER
jgi:hypothetical protein